MRRRAAADLLLSLLGCVALSGCAAVPRAERSTVASSGADPRVEIAQLEEGIAARRATLGLPSRSRAISIAAPEMDDDRAEHREPARPVEAPEPPSPAPFDGVANAPSGGAAAPARPSAPAAARPITIERTRAEEGGASEGVYLRPPRSERCRQVVQGADEICEAAEHICRIASDLREQAADDSCRTARLDCRDARDAAKPCR